MRLYAKKAFAGASVCLVVWFVLTYVSFANSPLGSDSSGSTSKQASAEADPEERLKRYLAERVDALERDLAASVEENRRVLEDIKRKLAERRHREERPIAADDNSGAIAVLVLACNRLTVRRCLDGLVKYRPDKRRFPIVVSQDCRHEQTRAVLEAYASAPDSGVSLVFQPDASDIAVPPKEKKFRGYFNIARHYQFALNHTFYALGYDAVIVVEDDLEVSPDFFEYFSGAHSLLLNDPTLWCVSAWNDNGKVGLIEETRPELLHRTDFFPGLGWMLLKGLWDELHPKWPKSYWDDWIRKPEQRKGRSCIRPELPRTITFGKIGVSNGLFFDKHLKLIKLNEHPVAFTEIDLSYLTKENYDKKFIDDINKANNVTLAALRTMEISSNAPSVRVIYTNKDEYKRAVRALGLMEDFRSGVGRTAYLGVVSCFYRGRRVYITPLVPQSQYDSTWN